MYCDQGDTEQLQRDHERCRTTQQNSENQLDLPFLWILKCFPAPFCVLNMIKIRKSASKPHVVVRLNLTKLWPCFCQHTQEKVHLLIQLAESMLAKGHAHRTELRRCVSTVDKRYRDFTVRMGQYRHLLETALGGCSQVNDTSTDCGAGTLHIWKRKHVSECDVILSVFAINTSTFTDVWTFA